MTQQAKSTKNIVTLFVEGARDGWHIGIHNVMPNVLFAFAIIKILQVTGFMSIISSVFTPIMTLWGLPGEAITVTVAALMSMGGATGVLISLFNEGVLTARDVTILLPAIFICGGQLQNIGRLLGTSDVNPKYYVPMLLITFLNGLLALTIMTFILSYY